MMPVPFSSLLSQALLGRVYPQDMMRSPYGGRIIYRYKNSVQSTPSGRTRIKLEVAFA
jgi:hypothetical protein